MGPIVLALARDADLQMNQMVVFICALIGFTVEQP